MDRFLIVGRFASGSFGGDECNDDTQNTLVLGKDLAEFRGVTDRGRAGFLVLARFVAAGHSLISQG